MDRQLPNSDWSTSGRVSSCKLSPEVGCFWLFTLWQTSNPILAGKKVDVFKINGDDDVENRNILHLSVTKNKFLDEKLS